MKIEDRETEQEFEDTSATDNLDTGADDQGGQDSEAGQETDTGAETEGTDAKAAASSEAGQDERKSLLEVVTTAAERNKQGAPSGTKGNEDTGKPEAAAAETPAGTGEADKGEQGKLPPFHEHPRWKELVSERDTLKGEAVQYRKITDFMTKHELAAEELAEGMLIMGMIKLSPEKGLARMEEHVSRLRELLGKSLPADLATQVEEGAVTEAVAKETAQLRRSNEAATREATRLTTERATEQARSQAATAQTALNNAVNTWETSARSRDPDFPKKAEFVVSEVHALMRAEGRPKTPEQAVDMSKRAYDNVTKRLSGIMPKPNTTRKTPQTNRSPSTTPTSQKRSLLDVVTAAANQPA